MEIIAALHELSGPSERGDKIKRAIELAAKRARLSYWRTFDLWYGKARRVESFEVAAINEALDKKRKEAARNELAELRTRITRLESLLRQIDPDFHGPSIDFSRDQLRKMD